MSEPSDEQAAMQHYLVCATEDCQKNGQFYCNACHTCILDWGYNSYTIQEKLIMSTACVTPEHRIYGSVCLLECTKSYL